MTDEVYPRYETQYAFRSVVERRFGDKVPDEVWEELGASIWRDADIEREYATGDDVNFAIRQLAHRRRTGALPQRPREVVGEPRDARLWRLRSKLVARRVEWMAREWRRSHLPAVPPGTDVLPPTPLPSETGREEPLRIGEYWNWLRELALVSEGAFMGKIEASWGDPPAISLTTPVRLLMPGDSPPQFVDPDLLPEDWCYRASTPSRPSDDRIDIISGGENLPLALLEPSTRGREALDSLAQSAKWVRSSGWDLAQLAGFFLFGAIPRLAPLKASVSSPSDEAGAATFVTMAVDYRIGAEEVEEFYRAVRWNKALKKPKPYAAKGFTERVSTLIEFVFDRVPPGEEPRWAEIWEAWQERWGSTRGWHYKSSKVLKQVAERSLNSLLRETGLVSGRQIKGATGRSQRRPSLDRPAPPKRRRHAVSIAREP